MIPDIDTRNMAVGFLSIFVALAVANAAILPKLDPRILNGEDAKEGEFPYQVSLQKDGNHFCGGSLINTTLILTAAHCVEGQEAKTLRVIVGKTNLADKSEALLVKQIFVYEKYDPKDSWRNDIALLQLEKALEFNKTVNATGLPSQGESLPDMTGAILSGWGRTKIGEPNSEILKKANVEIVKQTECENKYKNIFNVYATNVCADHNPESRVACNGDSGSPLVVKDKVVGIVSWSMSCSSSNFPTVYTRVASYVNWIQEKSAKK